MNPEIPHNLRENVQDCRELQMYMFRGTRTQDNGRRILGFEQPSNCLI
jgi:hypothetical protein